MSKGLDCIGASLIARAACDCIKQDMTNVAVEMSQGLEGLALDAQIDEMERRCEAIANDGKNMMKHSAALILLCCLKSEKEKRATEGTR